VKKLHQVMLTLLAMTLVVTLIAGCTLTIDPEVVNMTQTNGQPTSKSGYAPVNGLDIYYEIHGEGEPLVLLHGGLTTIDISFGALIPLLSQTRQVIAIEQQGHGHTADRDAPLTIEQMADDTAAVLEHLGIAQADFFGYSEGGYVAMNVAVRYPELVRKLALIGAAANPDGEYQWVHEYLQVAKVEDFEGLREPHASVAPDPDHWEEFVTKWITLQQNNEGLPTEALQSISAPALVIIGDADSVTPEHAVEMVRTFPHANLAILPATDHFAPATRADWIAPMLEDFLSAPMSEAQ
jgi:pimeloyl-ACP methyl ester carboxylesterase